MDYKGVDSIRIIKIGESRSFRVDHPKKITTIQSTIYRLNNTEPEFKKRYTYETDYENKTITITANPI
ncbi:hypothetical protein [Petrimonas sulfuriphila]|uniref:hypothetical protein n=1 Tax=Petrimonas sulfuriphila TaxID=285070 RepID=UPI003EB96D1B